ncbi:MAG: D-glycerate dehydrogenase [Ignavibacteria bacterium]|nr:D-glycerate dehydrogenase [Ignavibacteria bacterium]
MNKIFITASIPKIATQILSRNRIKVIQNDSYLPIEKKTLIKKAKDCVGLITLLSNRIDKEIIDNLPNLKIIANYAAGYNNIDYKYAAEKGICVTNTPDVLTNATADLAMALLLASARRLIEADNFTRSGKFKGWQSDLMLGKELYGKTLGIVGFGRIGRAVARRALSFGLRIIYNDLSRNEEFELAHFAEYSTLDNLLVNSDIISIHTPLTEKTYHLIGEKGFKLMKNEVIIINTSRGEVIDEKALIKNLKSKKVFSAGLDVYEFEPKISKELMKMKNVILLPHIGSATEETRNRMAEICAISIIECLNGKKPKNAVN